MAKYNLHCSNCCTLSESQFDGERLNQSREKHGGPFCPECGARIKDDDVVEIGEAFQMEGMIDYDAEDRRAYQEELISIRRIRPSDN